MHVMLFYDLGRSQYFINLAYSKWPLIIKTREGDDYSGLAGAVGAFYTLEAP